MRLARRRPAQVVSAFACAAVISSSVIGCGFTVGAAIPSNSTANVSAVALSEKHHRMVVAGCGSIPMRRA